MAYKLVIVRNVFLIWVIASTVIGHPSQSDHDGKAFDHNLIRILVTVNRRITNLGEALKDIKDEEEPKSKTFDMADGTIGHLNQGWAITNCF